MGPRRSQVRQEQRNFHVVSVVSTPWHQHMRFACFSGAGSLLKSYKPALVCAEGGVFKIHLLSELQERKRNERRDKSAHGISPLLFHHRKPLWSQQSSGCLQPARRYLRWAGTEDASSAEKSSCRQTPLTNRAFCVVTVWPSDFLLVGRDYSSGFGFSNWKQLAWAAICLFNRLPHSMHSCQMTKIRLTLSAKTAFLQIIIFYLA